MTDTLHVLAIDYAICGGLACLTVGLGICFALVAEGVKKVF